MGNNDNIITYHFNHNETIKELKRKGLYQKGIKAKIVRDKVEVHSIYTIKEKDQIVVDNIIKNLK